MTAAQMDVGSTIDSAFRHVMLRTGWPADQAIYQLTEALLAGRAQATCHHFVDGEETLSAGFMPGFKKFNSSDLRQTLIAISG